MIHTIRVIGFLIVAMMPINALGNAVREVKMPAPLRPFAACGVVITPEDLTLEDWPDRAKAAGLDVIGIHDGTSPARVAKFVRSKDGRAFLLKCRKLGIDVEYELHAMGELLPRKLFDSDPTMFRMNEGGKRTPDANLCVHSEEALRIVCENAADICRKLRPTTHRYYLWTDDGQPGCLCPKCRDFSASEQALIIENRMLAAIRKVDPKASLAHLAYAQTLEAPRKVKPIPGIFLEFAPINRDHHAGIAEGPTNQPILDALDANLKVFGTEGAQVLDYWLDVSLFSSWKKPAVEIKPNEALIRNDLETYAGKGIRRITTFAVYLDADYLSRYGRLPLDQYARALKLVRHTEE